MLTKILINYIILIFLIDTLAAYKTEKITKSKPIRNFGFLDKNLNTPEEYSEYRNRQKIEKAKKELLEKQKEDKRNEIIRKYLLPRVNVAVLKDFFSRF